MIICALASMVLALNAQEPAQAQVTDEAQILMDTIKVPAVRSNHNILVNIGGGLHTLVYKPEDGKYQVGGGALAQVMYQYMFNENWGIGVGLGFSSLRARTLFDDYKCNAEAVTHPEAIDIPAYNSETHFTNLKEIQDMIEIDLPIQAFYRYPVNDLWALNVGLGISLNFPVWSQWKVSKGQLSHEGTWGKYIHISDMPDHGLGYFDIKDTKGDFNYKTVNVGLQFDFGATRKLTDMLDFYMGIYLNGQFINTLKDNSVDLYDAENLAYAGALCSNQVSKANPLEFGLKLGLRVGTHDYKAEKAARQAKYEEYKEQARIAREKAEAERLAREKAEAARLAREKAEAERLAREREAARLAREKAIQDSIAAAEAAVQEKTIEIILQGVHFNHKSIVPIFDANAKEAIANLKDYLKEHPEKNLVLIGHTDNTGTPDNNIIWGQKRADAYKTALVAKGISAMQIITVSKGDTQPVATNDTEEGRALNRRVEMEMVTRDNQ